MPVRVRTFRDDDLGAARELWTAAEHLGPPPTRDLDRVRAVTPELVVVAELDDAVVGVALGGDDGRRGWISRLAVAETARRRGVARALVHELEDRLAHRGCRQINVLVFADNRPGRTLWEEAGYQHSSGVVMYRRPLDGPDGSC